MTTTPDYSRMQAQLMMNMDDDGSPLTPEREAEIRAVLNGAGEATEVQSVTDVQPQAAPQAAPQTAPQTGEPDIAAMIQAQVQQAMAGVIGQAQPQQVSLVDVLNNIDPRDSESALLLLEWLQKNQRISVVATLQGGGGYLYHYQEPKGSSKQGYTPGSTQGGRMVDQAVQKAQENGAKPRQTGICTKCFSAVEVLDSGTVVLDGSTDVAGATCSDGAAHTFQG